MDVVVGDVAGREGDKEGRIYEDVVRRERVSVTKESVDVASE